ncbi:MAG: class I SAM-dependent methyltransferase [Vulcanimicrobiota bacterium]
MNNMYDQNYADYYDYFSVGLPGEKDFYVELAKNTRGEILELGCGTGRILIDIAKEGINITGLDISPEMLEKAWKKVKKLTQEMQKNIELIQGSMENFSLGKKFDLIIIPYRAFLHLLTSQQQKSALERIYNHLRPEGKLVLNFFDPCLETIASHLDKEEPSMEKITDFVLPSGNNVDVLCHRVYYPGDQILVEDRVFEESDSMGEVVKKGKSVLKLRWIYRFEMEYLLELCGFSIENLYGDFHKNPYRYAGEQIWTAKKL